MAGITKWLWMAVVVAALLVGSLFVALNATQNSVPDPSERQFGLSPGGETVVFNAKGKGHRDLYLFDRSTGGISRLTDSPIDEEYPQFSPDGASVAYCARDGGGPRHLYLLTLGTRRIRRLTAADQDDSQPSFSPDGREVVFVRAHHRNSGPGLGWGLWEGDTLEVLNVSGGAPRSIGAEGWDAILSPRFSVDITLGVLQRFTLVSESHCA